MPYLQASRSLHTGSQVQPGNLDGALGQTALQGGGITDYTAAYPNCLEFCVEVADDVYGSGDRLAKNLFLKLYENLRYDDRMDFERWKRRKLLYESSS